MGWRSSRGRVVRNHPPLSCFGSQFRPEKHGVTQGHQAGEDGGAGAKCPIEEEMQSDETGFQPGEAAKGQPDGDGQVKQTPIAPRAPPTGDLGGRPFWFFRIGLGV